MFGVSGVAIATVRAVATARLTANRREKRREIIDVAKSVLLTHGLDRFTARALTDRGSFSRSAIHYYFDSVEEIIDAAMADYLDDFITTLRDEAARQDNPAERFWAVTTHYLDYFSGQPGLTLLWFDYSIARVQTGRPGPAIDVEGALRELFNDLLREREIVDWQSRSEALIAFMIGTMMRSVLHPGPSPADLRNQLSALSGLA